jgi:hypothetical protein
MKNRTLVFTAGEKPDYTYSNQDVKDIAESYSETKYSAPWVLGHKPKAGDPAAGWVRGLEYEEVEGVGHLYALSDFNKLGEKCIDSGEYENKSVSLYVPESEFNPSPGKWTLRHIAMLGAEPPVLKDLGPIAVIDYSEEETEFDFVDYSCACTKNNMEQNLETITAELEATKAELAKALEAKESAEEAEESAPKSELEILRAELAEARAQLNASKEANMALTVSKGIAPYYSEGAITEDVLPEATLTNVVTKLTLGLTNYSEEESPLVVIESLLSLLNTTQPEPSYGETWEEKDLPTPEKPVYESGDELHEMAVSTSKEYGLSYGQALSAVVEAKEVSVAKAVNFSECLANSIKNFRK